MLKWVFFFYDRIIDLWKKTWLQKNNNNKTVLSHTKGLMYPSFNYMSWVIFLTICCKIKKIKALQDTTILFTWLIFNITDILNIVTIIWYNEKTKPIGGELWCLRWQKLSTVHKLNKSIFFSCSEIKSQLQFTIIHLILNLPNRKIKLHLHIIIYKRENWVEINFSRFKYCCIKQLLYSTTISDLCMKNLIFKHNF